jgi:hypothetical protein
MRYAHQSECRIASQANARYRSSDRQCVALADIVADWQGLGGLQTSNSKKLRKTQRAAKEGTLDAYQQWKLRRRERKQQLVAQYAPELLPKLQALHDQEEITSIGDATEYEMLEEGGVLIPKPDVYYDLYKPSNSKELDYYNPYDFVELESSQAAAAPSAGRR